MPPIPNDLTAEEAPPPAAGAAAPADPPAEPQAEPAAPSGVPAEDPPTAVPAPDATTPATPSDDGNSSLIDELTDLIARNPRVAEAAALRRIEAIISSGGSSPDVGGALDALGDVDCRNNARTCVGVCGWAVLNCDDCAPDAECVAALRQECSRGCP